MQTGPQPPFSGKKTGAESELEPRPRYSAAAYKPAGKLEGKVAVVTGGDSGIGRAVAVLFAREGADVVVVYQTHDDDAQTTQRAIEKVGKKCVLQKGDVGDVAFCATVAKNTIDEFSRIDVLVNNAAHQQRKERIEDITEAELVLTFRTNIFSHFFMTQACLPHLQPGAAIIATGSETGLFGAEKLLDYASTKGAIHAFVKSLATNLVGRGIRVNAVAPGPVWTPLNPNDRGLSEEATKNFGAQSEYGRPAQPEEIAPAYVFLASAADSSFITGQIIAELGGTNP